MSQHSEIVEILLKLEEDNLLTLGRSITQGLIKINSTNDAIKAILRHSPDVLSILRRKPVTKEILFSYLDQKNIVVKLPATKNDIIDKILEVWNISPHPAESLASNSRLSIKNQQEFPSPTQSSQQESSSLQTNQETSTQLQRKEETNSISALAEQFTTWFYSLLNDQGVGSEHFYADAKLKVNLHSNDDCDTTLTENDPEEISKQLIRIKRQHNLLFNPNVSKEGTQGRMNPHGLVMVLACGTLHVQETCVGVFEQVFALARDPFCDNNWKIKNSEINLRSQGQIMGQPRLCDSELTSELLSLPSSQ